MVYKILIILILFLHFVGCTPTNENLVELTGGDSSTKTKVVPSDLGNQAFQFTPTSYDYGSIAVGSAPTSKVITIQNISSYTVYVSNITGPGGSFSLASDTCPRSPLAIAPNQSCTATVNFAPVAGGSLNSSLIITYGASAANNTAYTATMGLSGTGTGILNFSGIDTVSDIYSTQLKLNWTHVAGAYAYYVFKVNANGSQTLINTISAPATSYIVSGLTASTSYRFWVRVTDNTGAYDSNVNVVTTSTNNSPPAPVISGYANSTFASNGAISVGSALSMDLNDVRTGVATDSGVTYSCAYDQVVDNSVSASNNCGNLSGTFSFSTTSGALSWSGTTKSAIGFYEFNLRATDNTSSLTSQAITTVDIRPNYSTTNLIGNYSAMFSSGVTTQSAITTWQDLTSTNVDGTLNNFSFGGLYGWLGSGTVVSPYRLGLDGINDYVDFNTLGNTATSATFETWYKPSQINTSPVGYIMGNGDSGNRGITVREAKGYRNRVEAFTGNKNYADEVMADTPVVYLRMGDISGDSAYDIGSGAYAWTLNSTGVSNYAISGPLGGNDKAIQFNNVSYGYYTGNVVNTSAWSGVTYETWFRIDAATHALTTLFAHDSQQAVRTFYWVYINGAGGALQFQYVADGALRTQAIGVTPVTGTWYHLAVTINFTTKLVEAYVNGVNTLSTIVPYTAILASNDNASLKVGTYSPGTATYAVEGGMDEAAVYNYALTGARIQAHYNARTNYYNTVSNRLVNNTYNYISAAYNEFNTSLYLYTNSNLDAAVSTSAIVFSGTSAQMAVGAKVPSVNSPVAGTYLLGEVTDTRVYNTALSATTIKSNMDSQSEQYDIPKSVSNLQLWMKADSLNLADGTAVSTWTDSSTNSFTATQVGAARPTFKTNILNGKPVIRFDRTQSQYLDLGSVLSKSANFSYFAVYKTTDINQVQGVFGGLACCAITARWATLEISRNVVGSVNSYNSNGSNYSDAYTSSAVLTNNTFYITSSVYTNGSNYPLIYMNGVAPAISGMNSGAYATSNSGANEPFSIGRWGNYNAEYFAGDVAEIIIYSKALSDAERLRIEGYLKAKYGL